AMEPQQRLRRLMSSAESFAIQKEIGVEKYLRSGVEMMRMARMYVRTKELQNAYVLFSKFAIMVLDKLPKHPGFAAAPEHLKKNARLECKTALSEAERIKRLLLDQFAAEHAKAKAEAEAAEAARANAVAAKQAEEILPPVEPSAPPPPYSGADASSSTIAPPSLSEDFGLSDSSWGSHSGVGSLRTLVLPAQLGLRFLRLADSNTAANKETCGILCGSVRDGALAVTDLVLPKQSGTSDSCTTSGEEEIFGVLDRFDLVTLGWVHTHPTQTAFLSSIDLHTHLSYQLMLPEAVAVVCAPKFGDTATFTLTQHGLDYLSRCSGKGFHPHQEHPPLFERAKHAIDAPEGDLKVHDLR
ncbi:hypothetical protein BOX15_Mlig002293g1, partial [Macrostomum lignano]